MRSVNGWAKPDGARPPADVLVALARGAEISLDKLVFGPAALEERIASLEEGVTSIKEQLETLTGLLAGPDAAA